MHMCRSLCRGNVETFNSRFADVLSLKQLVFNHGFESLKAETEKRYSAYRQKITKGDPEEAPEEDPEDGYSYDDADVEADPKYVTQFPNFAQTHGIYIRHLLE